MFVCIYYMYNITDKCYFKLRTEDFFKISFFYLPSVAFLFFFPVLLLKIHNAWKKISYVITEVICYSKCVSNMFFKVRFCTHFIFLTLTLCEWKGLYTIWLDTAKLQSDHLALFLLLWSRLVWLELGSERPLFNSWRCRWCFHKKGKNVQSWLSIAKCR